MVDPKTTARIEQLVKRICNELCFYPEALSVSEETFNNCLGITLQPHRADAGRIIGQGGQTAKDLNMVFSAIGARYGVGVEVTIKEPTIGEKDRGARNKTDWNEASVLAILKDILFEMMQDRASVRVEQSIGNKRLIVVTISERDSERSFLRQGRMTVMPDATRAIGYLMLSISLTYRMELIVDFVTRNQMAKTI